MSRRERDPVWRCDRCEQDVIADEQPMGWRSVEAQSLGPLTANEVPSLLCRHCVDDYWKFLRNVDVLTRQRYSRLIEDFEELK